MRAKTIIYYTRDNEVKKIKSNAGRTRHNKAAAALYKNSVEPFTRYKFMRFIGRLGKKTTRYVARHYKQPDAATIPPIGLIEGGANGNLF